MPLPRLPVPTAEGWAANRPKPRRLIKSSYCPQAYQVFTTRNQKSVAIRRGGLFTLFILLMEEILHQYVVSPIIYRVLHIPVQDFFHQQYFQQKPDILCQHPSPPINRMYEHRWKNRCWNYHKFYRCWKNTPKDYKPSQIWCEDDWKGLPSKESARDPAKKRGSVGKAVHKSIGQCEFVGGVSKLQWGFECIWEFTLSEFEFFRGCSPLNKYLMAHGT